ncbi:MAG: HAD-IIIA family hydrolase [Bacteroidia bacterium]|nr:HAD-IIIA family hydrolase [Bacteroidia bacterium]MDW8333481.1 HAD-IIIA family hydrolase [Bacteroidia bacterium]
MRAAIFDRDGVVNVELGYIRREEDFRLNPEIERLFGRLVADGFLIFVVTNQGGVGLGMYDRRLLDRLHGRIKQMGAKEVFCCPHHPLTGRCLCRKPQTLLYERIAARYRPTWAVAVGDRERDLTPARVMGWTTVRIGPARPDDPPFTPDHAFDSTTQLWAHYTTVFDNN